MHYRTLEYRHAETILNSNHRLKKEMEFILCGLELDFPRPYANNECSRPHQQIQRAFLKHGWHGETPVSRRRDTRRQYFDLYKDRIAVEIELSSRSMLYRDYVRFLMAEAEGHMDVGVILLLDHDARDAHPVGMRNGLPRLEDVEDDLRSLRSVFSVPIWVVALS